MKQSTAMELLIDHFGLVRGSQLLQYAAQLQGVGPDVFDRVYSQQLRSKVSLEMAAAGVYWDAIEWDGGVAGWYVALAKRAMKRIRQPA